MRCTEAAIAPLRRQGIRLATYLDDWLLLAQSEQEARAHTRILLRHLYDLGFVINAGKSMLSPAQGIIFLGLSLDSVTFTARLPAARVKAFRACLALFHPRKSVQFRLCLRLLGLMASAILVVHLGRLHMREFQFWVSLMRARSRASWRTEGAGYTGVRQGAAPLASLVLSDPRGAHGSHPVQEGGHYGRQPDRLERNSRGPVCEGPLGCGPPAVSHTFSGTFSGVPLPETFPSITHESSCPGEDGQYDDGGVHQPSGGIALPSVAHAGTQTHPVELRSSPLPESDARPGSPEHGRGPVVQGRASIRGVDAAPRDCGTDMGPFRSGRGGSVRVERQRAVRAVLLSAQHGCSPRRRHASACLAA